jgi:hypothetical protein
VPILLVGGVFVDLYSLRIGFKKILIISALIPVFLLFNIKHDYIYFNGLKQMWKPGSFSMDYWGISTLSALKKFDQDENPKKIYAFTETVWLNKQLMGKDASCINQVNTADSADLVLVLNREGKLDSYNLPMIANDVYAGDTLWKIYDRRSEKR